MLCTWYRLIIPPFIINISFTPKVNGPNKQNIAWLDLKYPRYVSSNGKTKLQQNIIGIKSIWIFIKTTPIQMNFSVFVLHGFSLYITENWRFFSVDNSGMNYTNCFDPFHILNNFVYSERWEVAMQLMVSGL